MCWPGSGIMSKYQVRLALFAIGVLPLVAAILGNLLIDGSVTRGTLFSAVLCSVVQVALLLMIQLGAEQTDQIARDAHRQVTEAGETDYVKVFDDGLK
jgi:hypothetical protein